MYTRASRSHLTLTTASDRPIFVRKKDMHMFDYIRKALHCISVCLTGEKPQPPQPLRIEGVAPAPITPAPDDAELAAQALLESMEDGRMKKEEGQKAKGKRKAKNERLKPLAFSPQPSKEYYEQLAERVREGREMEARMTLRFVAYCEQELRNHLLPEGRIAGLERDLLQRMDIVEREGGELKRRWQHCLAEVTLRLIESNDNDNDNEDEDEKVKVNANANGSEPN